MRIFPETIATQQDVENIINDFPEYHNKLKAILQRAYDEPDEADEVISWDIDPETGEMINVKTKKVKKDKMKYKYLGFADKQKLKQVIDNISLAKIK